MGHHQPRAQAAAQSMRNPLRQTPRVDKNNRCPMCEYQFGKPVIHLIPHLCACHRAQNVSRNLDMKLHLAPVPDIHNLRVRPEQASHLFNRLHRRREPDPLRSLCRQRIQPRQRQRQVRSALVVSHRMNLIDNERRRALQHMARPLRRQQNEKRFRRGHQDVWRLLQHPRAVRHRRVAGSYSGPNRRQLHAFFFGQLRDLGEWDLQVPVHVIAERLERRHVDHVRRVLQRLCARRANQLIDTDEKRRERLTGAGGGGNERIAVG